MAATKTRAKPKSGRRSTQSSSKASAASKRARTSRASASKSRSTQSRSSNGSSASRSTASKNASRNGSSRTAKNGVARAARKAKTPLIASGAAIAGAAGGLALGSRHSRGQKVMGVRMPHRPRVHMKSRDLAKAAKNVGDFGAQVGELAVELRKNREQANGGKSRSPIEVVLEGLTSRGRHS